MTAASAKRRVGVVVLIDTLERPGGGERLALENVLRLDPDRYDRALCLSRWSDEMAASEPARELLARAEAAGVRLIAVRRTSRLEVRAWLPLWRELRSGRIDILHGHLIGSNFWASVIGSLARVPVVVAHEHMWSYSSGRTRPLVDREVIARLSSAFVAVSEHGMRSMIELERISPSDLVLIRNGIEAPSFLSREEAKQALGVSDREVVIGSIGHLRTEKAFKVLVDAVAELGRSRPGITAVIIGEGPERAMLEGRALELGISDRVRLVGAREGAASFLRAFDVAVCCSDFEGGPLSVMEYMASGVPIVATRVGGLPELLEEGAAGLLIAPRDPVALAGAVESALEDAAGAAARAERAAELQRTEYDLGAWIGRIEALYARLLNGRSPE